MIQAILFDFDGLILDTEGPDYESWQEIYREHGCSLPLATWGEYIGRSVGSYDPHAELEAQLGRALDRDAIRARRRRRYHELVAARSVLPGVAEYIADAKRLGLKLGVASSSDRAWVTGHLSRLALDFHFDCIRCLEDVRRAKPDPELYKCALEVLGVGAAEAIALEDSPHGITAAKQAGIFCVAVPNPLTGQLSLDHADLRLTSLAEFPLESLLLEVYRVRGRSTG
jgi:HAD superfamily hydrolase (TIGR01509 family)